MRTLLTLLVVVVGPVASQAQQAVSWPYDETVEIGGQVIPIDHYEACLPGESAVCAWVDVGHTPHPTEVDTWYAVFETIGATFHVRACAEAPSEPTGFTLCGPFGSTPRPAQIDGRGIRMIATPPDAPDPIPNP